MALRVSPWDTENLCRPARAVSACPRRAYQRKLDHNADLVDGTNADVLALQEICSEESLAGL
jgi:hypothetical protein